MQVVKKGLIFLLIFWVAVLLFMPKEEIYFRLEQVLAKQGVEINEASVDESFAALVLKEPVIYAKGVKAAHAETLSFFTVLLYSEITLSQLHIEGSLKAVMPKSADKIILIHSVLNPLYITISAKGSFGEAHGYIALKEKKVHIDFNETKKLGMIKKSLKKGEKGWYYETDF